MPTVSASEHRMWDPSRMLSDSAYSFRKAPERTTFVTNTNRSIDILDESIVHQFLDRIEFHRLGQVVVKPRSVSCLFIV